MGAMSTIQAVPTIIQAVVVAKPICPWSIGDILNSPFLDLVILVGIVGVLLGRFVLDPYFAYKKTIRDIDSALLLYANAFMRSSRMSDATSRPITEHFRRLASDFSSCYRDIPKWCRPILIRARLILSQQKRQQVQEYLITLANVAGDQVTPDINPYQIMTNLRRALNIEA